MQASLQAPCSGSSVGADVFVDMVVVVDAVVVVAAAVVVAAVVVVVVVIVTALLGSATLIFAFKTHLLATESLGHQPTTAVPLSLLIKTDSE